MVRYFIYFSVIVALSLLAYLKFHKSEHILFNARSKHHEYVIAQAHVLLGFDLVDPEQAPPSIKNSVMRGYSIIMNTPFFASNYAKDELSCTSCHFCGGDTIGGRNNGISLVGVTNIYPQFSQRDGTTISLGQRINNCFERSMNGKPLPLDSQEMKDILAYLDWISNEVKLVKNPPWLGLGKLKSKHQPNIEQGEIIYNTNCADCHKDSGSGGGKLPEPVGKTIPPIWGENSFNDGAGMSHLATLSSFIYWNMPYQNSVLTEEQAIDVAAFVLSKPRAHFEIKKKE